MNTSRLLHLGASLLALAAAAHAQQAPSAAPAWDVYADTWVATDALGRSLPTGAQAGPPRAHRELGIFYFLWLGRSEANAGPYDITKILAQDPDALQKPDSPLWGGLYGFHHWGEPLWGYYNNADPAILRKHAQMLSDAGVDMLLFDASNGYNYPEVVNALARVYRELQSQGQKVPLLAFHTVASSGEKQVKQVQEIYDAFYKSGHNDSLWYRWEGKPLIIADPNQTFPEGIGEYFTFRKTYWGGKNPGPGSWDTDGFYPAAPLARQDHAQGRPQERLERLAEGRAGVPRHAL